MTQPAVTHRRAKGSGSIGRQAQRWVAYAPRGNRGAKCIVGRFDYRRQAEEALNAWIREHVDPSYPTPHREGV